MNHPMLVACCAAAFGLSPAAFAQPAVNTPADQKPAPVQLRYSSSFADYKPWQDLPAGDWRQLNDHVRRAAEKGTGPAADAAMPMPMAMPMPAAKPANAASSAAAPMPPMNHGGHAGHGGKP